MPCIHDTLPSPVRSAARLQLSGMLAADSSPLRHSLGLNGTVLPPSPDKAISSDSLIPGNKSLPSFSRAGTTQKGQPSSARPPRCFREPLVYRRPRVQTFTLSYFFIPSQLFIYIGHSSAYFFPEILLPTPEDPFLSTKGQSQNSSHGYRDRCFIEARE